MRLSGGFRSKHESTIASATVTFWCITVVPAGAPMMPPTRSPAADEDPHQPSPPPRAPGGRPRPPPASPPRARAARPPLAREPLEAPLRLGGHRAERVVDQVRG